MKSVLVFCEGRHDVIFAQRCLGSIRDFNFLDLPIGKLPSPFGRINATSKGLIESWCERSSIEELKLRDAVNPPSPVVQSIVTDEDTNIVVILVRTNGIDQVDGVVRILENLKEIFEGPQISGFKITQYATAFLFDANDRGLKATLDFFRQHYNAHFGDMPDLEHGKWIIGNGVPVGCFVFHDTGAPRKTGTLETHVGPMTKDAWPDRFWAAKKFVDDNARERDAARRDKAKRMKAIITSAGQFDNPGSPLSEIIGRNGLPKEQFELSPASRELAVFLTSVSWELA